MNNKEPSIDAYEKMAREFRWEVPEKFNIAYACMGRWQFDGEERPAIIEHRGQSDTRRYSQADLSSAANKLAQVLILKGVRKGDRIAIVLPQCFITAAAYMAAFKVGAVAMPLSLLFGIDALQFRLQDSGATMAFIGNSPDADVEKEVLKWKEIRRTCPALKTVIGFGFLADREDCVDVNGTEYLAGNIEAPETPFVETSSEDPAILIYTSGTTGNPKGGLLPQRALIGNLSGFMCSQNGFGFWKNISMKEAFRRIPDPHPTDSDAIFWSPADWAWTGGLMDALLPALYYGRPIVACAERFTPQLAYEILHIHGITHTFLFPTALKAMMSHFPTPGKQFDLKLEALMSAGEAVGDAVFEYCRRELGVVLNEMFGQTEVNYIVGNCAFPRQWLGQDEIGWPPKPGSMGRGYIGHRIAVINEDGEPCEVGEVGEIALHRKNLNGQDDPIFFLGYWQNEKATAEKFTGDPSDSWCKTGDLAIMDADGYLWYQGRSDDVFKSSGYRIGPNEIENCLIKHPAVAYAAVVPKPDKQRGAVVKAFVVLNEKSRLQLNDAKGAAAESLKEQWTGEMQEMVKQNLAPYEYPKEIEFIDALPMTNTGKIQRRILRLREEELFKSRNP